MIANSLYDVAIAGAGPAGSAAAIRLMQEGFKVCMIDDRDYSKRKVGESLPGASIRLLDKLGIPSLGDLIPKTSFSSCTANISAWGSNRWQYQDAMLNPEGGGWHIMRNEFDQALLQKALDNGTEHFNSKISKLCTVNEAQRLTFKTPVASQPDGINCKWLIDASGRARALTKLLNIPTSNYQKQMAAIAWTKSPERNEDQTIKIKSTSSGWWYTSPLPDCSRVIVFHGLLKSVADFVKEPDGFFMAFNEVELLPYSVSKLDLLEGITARDASVSKLSCAHGKQWLAVGDACLSFDPLSSQGMFFALYSGIIGAEAIIRATRTGQCDLEAYQAKIDSVFLHNQQQRKFLYQAESRFIGFPYWNQYFDTSRVYSVK